MAASAGNSSDAPPLKRSRAEDRVMPNLYTVLGLKPTAELAEIQRRYKRLALEFHPDRNVGREDAAKTSFQGITEAYRVLSDIELRRAYDARFNVNFSGRVADLAARAGGHTSRPAPPSQPPTESKTLSREDHHRKNEDTVDTSEDDDDDYNPSYSSHVTASVSQPSVVHGGRPRLVRFVCLRPRPDASLGLRLDRMSLVVEGTVDGSPASEAGVPAGARLVSINRRRVRCIEDVVAASVETSEQEGAELEVPLVALCAVATVTLPRASVLKPSMPILELLGEGPDAPHHRSRISFPSAGASAAVCTIGTSTKDCGGAVLQPAGADSWVDVSGAWSVIPSGSPVLAVVREEGAEALLVPPLVSSVAPRLVAAASGSPSRATARESAEERQSSSREPSVGVVGGATPQELAARRLGLQLIVLCQ